jgi:hypothetical protein
VRAPLSRIAHTRSGDKGDTCNIGVIALDERHYPVLAREVTAERVKRHFGELVKGNVERFPMPMWPGTPGTIATGSPFCSIRGRCWYN